MPVPLIFLGAVMYKALTPITDQLGSLSEIFSQALPGLKPATLDPYPGPLDLSLQCPSRPSKY